MDLGGRFPEPTGDVRLDAARQLRWAMGGAGLTVDKLARMSAVLGLPAIRDAMDGVPPEFGPQAAYEALQQAVRALGDGPQARALRSALGIDYAGNGKDLGGRRREFIELNDMAATERTMYSMERRMAGALLIALGAPPDVAPAYADGQPAAVAYHFVSREITHRMFRRAGRQAEVVNVLRAIEGGLNSCTVAYYCTAQNTRTANVVVREGGLLTDDRQIGQLGLREATIQLPRPLAAGETHRIRYDICYPPRQKGDQWLVIGVIRPTGSITMRVVFDEAELPDHVWRLDAVLPEAGAGDREACPPLVPDRFGCVEVLFAQPRMPFGYGVAWDWSHQ